MDEYLTPQEQAELDDAMTHTAAAELAEFRDAMFGCLTVFFEPAVRAILAVRRATRRGP